MTSTNACTPSSSSCLIALSGHTMPTHLMDKCCPSTKQSLRHRMTSALATIPYAIGLCCVWLFERDEVDRANEDKTNTKTDGKAVHRAKQPDDYDPWMVPMFWC